MNTPATTDQMRNCPPFFSRRQCLASVYGVGGFCTVDTVQESVVVYPVQTRRVLGLALSACLNKPVQETKYGVFRM